MAAAAYKLAIGAVPVRLSDAYPASPGGGVVAPGTVNAATDLPLRQIILQAETADIEIGDANVTVSNNYGVKLAFTAPAPPLVLGPYESGPLHLSDFYAISTSATLHILTIPY